MREFLDFLLPKIGVLEQRAMWQSDSMDNIGKHQTEQSWFDLANDGIDGFIQVAQRHDAAGHDVYYGVLPRMRLHGAADDAWPVTTILWADIDAKQYGDLKTPDGLTDAKNQALLTLLGFDIPPSVIVDSGHGYHAYWKLHEGVPFADARLAMQGIAKQVRGDATYDAARILRVPGTHNHKLEHRVLQNESGVIVLPPADVRLIRLDTTRRHRFSDFNDVMDSITPVRQPPRLVASKDQTPYGELPDWLLNLIESGAPTGMRSEASFKVAMWLARLGWDDGQISQVFDTTPIGAKYRELGGEGSVQGSRWLRRTLEKVREIA